MRAWPARSPLLRDGLQELVDVEAVIETALAKARTRQVTGQQVTPFVLAEIHRQTAGESVRINKQLIADNAALAAEVAVAYAAR